jgi:predicted metal-dependent enzyme (double-stranded beta helix superfamily)
MTDPIAPLREFVLTMTALVSRTAEERTLLAEGRAALTRLIAEDTWLPEAFARPRPDRYAQYLLHCDALERFSVVSFVWGPGQRTPVHDHTVWGLVGVLRGAELCEEYTAPGTGAAPCPTGRAHRMQPGDIEAVSPAVGDWHRVGSAREDGGTTVSIHVYGANIGAVRRHRVDDAGRIVDFVSGYDAAELPNLWDRSAAVRAGFASR